MYITMCFELTVIKVRIVLQILLYSLFVQFELYLSKKDYIQKITIVICNIIHKHNALFIPRTMISY